MRFLFARAKGLGLFIGRELCSKFCSAAVARCRCVLGLLAISLRGSCRQAALSVPFSR
jgi:hypothetical protein